MQEQAKRFLEFIEKELDPERLSIENWKTYLAYLPTIYSQDITFRLLFDWHWDLKLNVFSHQVIQQLGLLRATE